MPSGRIPDGIPNGLRSAASAMRYLERRQELLTNNLANASTVGFKGERAFATLLEGALPTIQAATDLAQGALTVTDRPLDLALGGAGFFVVDTPAGERLTRGGSFSLRADGTVVTAQGQPLLGETGPLVLPEHARTFSIDAAGLVSVDGRPHDRLRIENAPPEALRHEGGLLFVADGRSAVALEDRQVQQQMLESSNVNNVDALVDMIEVQRAYSAAQKAMLALDEIRGTAVTQLARPI